MPKPRNDIVDRHVASMETEMKRQLDAQIAGLEAETDRVNALGTTSPASRAELTKRLKHLKELASSPLSGRITKRER